MKLKNIVLSMICGLMVAGTMGATVFAAGSGFLSCGIASGTYATAALVNTSGSAKYCSVSIQAGTSSSNCRTIVSDSRVVQDGNSISVGTSITQSYGQGTGIVYNSVSPSSGVAATYIKRIW